MGLRRDCRLEKSQYLKENPCPEGYLPEAPARTDQFLQTTLGTNILTIPGNNTLLVRHSEGVGALPAIAYPVPGALSSGVKILKALWNGNNYVLTGEGRSGDTCLVKVFHTKKIKQVEQADIVSDKGGIVTLQISLPAAVVAGQRYTQQEARLYFE